MSAEAVVAGKKLWPLLCLLAGCSWTVSVPCVQPDETLQERLQNRLDELEGRVTALDVTMGEISAMIESHVDWTGTSEEAEEPPGEQLLEAQVLGGKWR